MTWLLLCFGLVMLIAGADLLVKGAARLATNFGIPPLVIGLTVVAFGTSAPELAVSVKAAYSGQAELAIDGLDFDQPQRRNRIAAILRRYGMTQGG